MIGATRQRTMPWDIIIIVGIVAGLFLHTEDVI